MRMSPVKLSRAMAICLLVLTAKPFSMATAHAGDGFRKWVDGFRATAAKSGITHSTFDRAFEGVTAPDPEVLEKARYQPEFRAPAWRYFDSRVHEDAIANGRAMLRKWELWLTKIEREFGVSRHVLLAIWSMETNYGAILKNDRVMRNVVRSLSTLAYADNKRRKFARQQLIAALKILQRGDIDIHHLEGSWAGAMGHTQFIPTSYMAYAVDMDGDGRRDIWNSIPDALATAANLLRQNGWRSGQTWGYEVNLPKGRKFPDGSLEISRWKSLGVKRVNGRAYPRGGDNAVLKIPQGRAGPAFLATKNFFVLKRYNNADKYALAVGLLADEIAGYGGLRKGWDRPFTRLSFSEKRELQKHLLALGYYDGKIDGMIGNGSRKAIMAFQAHAGMKQTGYPGREVLTAIKRRRLK